MSQPLYKPYLERIPDMQYQDLLQFILESPETYLAKNRFQVIGRWTNLVTPALCYKYENGFPIPTERKVSFWKTPITELILFINGVRRLEQMEAAGLGWWREWLTPEKCAAFGLEPGDMGPGSYGAILHDMPDGKGGTFNQIENLVQSLKDFPDMNRHIITTWFPPFAMQHSKLRRQVVVAPCHGTKVQCTVIDRKYLVVNMNQCSCDVPVGGVANIIQYAAFGIILAHVCGYVPYMYIHKIDDAQIYENQVEIVRELVERDPFPFPTLRLTEEGQKVENIFDFTADHFELTDYQSHPGMKIPTTL